MITDKVIASEIMRMRRIYMYYQNQERTMVIAVITPPISLINVDLKIMSKAFFSLSFLLPTN